MYTQFFGNYLLSKGYVTQSQLFAAMQKQSSIRPKLGTLAMHAGYMNATEVDAIVSQQSFQDRKFGELAIENGYLTQGQVIELLKSQSPDFLLLGQELVDEGALTNKQLEDIIRDYRMQNGITDLDNSQDNSSVMARLFENMFQITGVKVSKYGKMYMELLFNDFIRFIGDDFTAIAGSKREEYSFRCGSSQKIIGEYSIISYIEMDKRTAIKFASRYIKEELTEYNEYVQASMDDFLNLHNGLFIVNVSNADSLELAITAPIQQDDQIVEFIGETYHFPIEYSFGSVHFIIQILKA